MNRLSRAERVQKIVDYLAADARAPIMRIARDLVIPKSTVFDDLRRIKQKYIFTLIDRDRWNQERQRYSLRLGP